MEFYFDYISPNAYLAWRRIGPLAAEHGRRIEPIPVLFAALLDATGAIGPAENPPLMRWMAKDVLRKCRLYGIPVKAPAFHPFNPLLALRLTALELEPARRARLIDRLFAEAWARGGDVSDPDVAAAILEEIGLDNRAALAEARSSAVKERIREYTAAAIAKGVFGVPTMIVDGELFWGFDDFRFLERYLQGVDDYDAGELAAWNAVRPSAARR